MLNRRQFAHGTLGLLAAAGLSHPAASLAASALSPAKTAMRFSALPGKEIFSALQGELFHLRDEHGNTSEARLIAVGDEGCCRELEQFSLLFQSPPTPQLSENLYTLEHRTAGRCRLHLQPRGDGPDSQYLTAVFSLLR